MVLNRADGDDDLRGGASSGNASHRWRNSSYGNPPLASMAKGIVRHPHAIDATSHSACHPYWTLPHTLSSTVFAIDQLVPPRYTAAQRGSPSDLCANSLSPSRRGQSPAGS